MSLQGMEEEFQDLTKIITTIEELLKEGPDAELQQQLVQLQLQHEDLARRITTRKIVDMEESYRQYRRYVLEVLKNGTTRQIVNLLYGEVQPVTEVVERFSTISNLVDFRLGVKELPSVVEKYGKLYIITTSEVPEVYIREDPDTKIRARRFISRYPASSLCHCIDEIQANKLRYFAMDPFTTRTFVRYIIQDIFEKERLPHCSTLHYAYVSIKNPNVNPEVTEYVKKNYGWTLYDMISIGSIDEFIKQGYLTVKRAASIIRQCLVIFKCLSKHNYSHGNCSSQSLLFKKQDINYIYDGIHINCDFAVQLTDMWFSSITYQDKHIFDGQGNPNTEVDCDFKTVSGVSSYCVYKGLADFPIPLACDMNSTTCPTDEFPLICDQHAVSTYRFPGQLHNIYNYIRHLGFPLFVGTFDFYCLFVSLMCLKPFYDIVYSNNFLQGVWLSLWINDEYLEVEKRLADIHNTPGEISQYLKQQQAIEIIQDRSLRCDLIEFLSSTIGALDIETFTTKNEKKKII